MPNRQFKEGIDGLEQVSLDMLQACNDGQWERVAGLDERRAQLLGALGSADEHTLSDNLRDKIQHILDLDHQILQRIASARSEQRRLLAREDSEHNRGAVMYAQMQTR